MRSVVWSFVLALSCSCVYAQDAIKVPENEKVTIVLAGGSQMLVDEVSEGNGGYWYKRGNMTTFIDRKKVLRVEVPTPPETSAPETKPRKWSLADAAKVEQFFAGKFNKPLPTTAFGQSDLHTRWGLDHRNGMDVGLHPDSVEGRALIEFLRAESIPYLVFRGPIPGVATGPHIHIGNRSSRTYGR
ncbi:MAG TPA: hypothetical protein VFI24_28060 [Pyrinomonadaceae bacterium]|nr:hypothetical protein [Pyrinomonadaceae bacterium]